MNLKFNRKNPRRVDFDYTTRGYYMITAATVARKIVFGTISYKKMKLNDLEKIALNCWNEIPHHFQDVKTDEFIVMPDHIHGILMLDNHPALNSNLVHIVGPYKSSVSRIIHTTTEYNGNIWQRSFHDVYIRTDRRLQRLRNYIRTNSECVF